MTKRRTMLFPNEVQRELIFRHFNRPTWRKGLPRLSVTNRTVVLNFHYVEIGKGAHLGLYRLTHFGYDMRETHTSFHSVLNRLKEQRARLQAIAENRDCQTDVYHLVHHHCSTGSQGFALLGDEVHFVAPEDRCHFMLSLHNKLRCLRIARQCAPLQHNRPSRRFERASRRIIRYHPHLSSLLKTCP